MDYYILQMLIKLPDRKDDAIEMLERSAQRGVYVDIFNNNSHLITYLFDQDDHVTLGKLLDYYKKYFLDIHERDTVEHFANYKIAEDAIAVSTGECEMSEEMRKVLNPFLCSDTSTEDGFEADATEDGSFSSEITDDGVFNRVFSLEADPEGQAELLGESE